MRKQIRNILALIISVFTINAGITQYVYAAETVDDESDSVYSSVAEDEGVYFEDLLVDTGDHNLGVVKPQRLYAEETSLNEEIYLNSDGTKTVRMYDYPVKYQDADGRIKDINLSISANKSSGDFESRQGAIRTTYSGKISDGICLDWQDMNVTLIPRHKPLSEKATERSIVKQQDIKKMLQDIIVSSAAKLLDENIVSYYYDDKTRYEYSTTYTGFKEDIVVEEYTGETEYYFNLKTNGLFLNEIDNSLFLVDSDGEPKAAIGDILIFTADERNNTMGSMTYSEIAAGEEYCICIHVDPDYLANPATVYPIRIDPTIEVVYGSNGAGAILDVNVNSVKAISGSYDSLYVGKHATYGICRVLMQFPGLNLSAIPSADCITSAKVELRDLMCQSNVITVYCHQFNGNSWNESNATWNSVVANNYGAELSHCNISYANGVNQPVAHRYAFDITNAVKAWKNGTAVRTKGVLFKASGAVENSSTANNKVFASYNRTSYRPSVSVTYNNLSTTDYYFALYSNGSMLKTTSTGGLTTGSYSGTDATIKWSLSTVSQGVYIIRQKSNLNKCLTYDTAQKKLILSNVVSGNSNQYWAISGGALVSKSTNANLSGKKIYYTNGIFTLTDTAYTQIGAISVANYVPCTKISIASISVDERDNTVARITYTPISANMISNTWTTYQSSNTQVFTVSSNGSIYGVKAGTATLTVRNKITGVTGTQTVTVNKMPSEGQNKTNWCWAAVTAKMAKHDLGSECTLPKGKTLLINTDGLLTYDGVEYFLRDGNQIYVDAGQSAVVQYIYGSDINKGGDWQNMSDALIHFSGRYVIVEAATTQTGSGVVLSSSTIAHIHEVLERGKYVAFTAKTSNNSHAMLIIGYGNGTYTYWEPTTNKIGTFSESDLQRGSIRINVAKNAPLYDIAAVLYYELD